MEEKNVCNYCGTVYDAHLDQCPLCGSPAEKPEDPQAKPEPQPTRRPAYRSGARRKKGKTATVPRNFLVAAVILLALAVLIIFYFIGDMIGWWPGFEDLVKRRHADAPVEQSDCTSLTVEPSRLHFTKQGESVELRVTVNADCTTVPTLASSELYAVSRAGKETTADTVKTYTFIITALKSGSEELRVTCGGRAESCAVVCELDDASTQPTDPSTDPSEPSEPTEPSSEPTTPPSTVFTPELNYEDVTLKNPGETLPLKVLNLPSGKTPVWSSEDPTVAKVDTDGKVTAVSGGTTKISVEVDGKTESMIVRCDFAGSLENGYALNRTDVTIKVGEEFRLSLMDAEQKRIEGATYTTSNASVCTVSDKGIVTGTGKGTTNVIVTYEGVDYTCIVRVKEKN